MPRNAALRRMWRDQQGSNVAQAAAVALAAALLIATIIAGSQTLRPAVEHSMQCLASAISGGGGCSPGAAQAQGSDDVIPTSGSDSGGEADSGGGIGGWFSAGIDFIPVVGEVKGLIEVFTGRDLVTGEDLGAWRWAGLAGLIGLNEIKHLRHAAKVVDAPRRV
ncbi:MAG: pre-toxin TG domain-containing protein, partial [Chloroflexi bacterium]|nr:pre-toxin TG domain-containing protein [Chloroflexota bacterium]